jgi:hypothetical protein
VTLPDEYAEWARGGLRPSLGAAGGGLAVQVAATTAAAPVPAASPAADSARPAAFRIVSPLDGDRYAVPPGIEARYSPIALRAAGPGAERVQWSVDGAPHAGGRWQLRAGTHVVRAVSARGEAAEARIVVER